MDAVERLEALHRALAAVRLVGDHTPDAAVEDAGGRAEVEGAVGGVGVGALAQFVEELELVAVEGAGDVDVLAAHAHDALAVQQLLGHDGRGRGRERDAAGPDAVQAVRLRVVVPDCPPDEVTDIVPDSSSVARDD